MQSTAKLLIIFLVISILPQVTVERPQRQNSFFLKTEAQDSKFAQEKVKKLTIDGRLNYDSYSPSQLKKQGIQMRVAENLDKNSKAHSQSFSEKNNTLLFSENSNTSLSKHIRVENHSVGFRTDFHFTRVSLSELDNQALSNFYIYDLLYDKNSKVIWFTVLNDSNLWKFDPQTLELQNYSTSIPSITPSTLIMDEYGHIWTLDFNFVYEKQDLEYLVQFIPSNETFLNYEIPTLNSGPFDLEYYDNAIWFTEWLGDKVGKFDIKTHEMKEYLLDCQRAVCQPLGIVLDNDRLFFLETARSSLIEFDTEKFEEKESIEFPTNFPGPTDITIKNGLYWMGIHGGSQLGYYDPNNDKFEIFYTFPSDAEFPVSGINEVMFDENDNLWFDEHFVNRVGKFDVNSETIHEYRLQRNRESNTQWMTTDGKIIWYAETDNGILSQFNSSSAPTFEISTNNMLQFELHTPHQINFNLKHINGLLNNSTFETFIYSPLTTQINQNSSQIAKITPEFQDSVFVSFTNDINLRAGVYTVIIGIQNSETIISLNIKVEFTSNQIALFLLLSIAGFFGIIMISIGILSKKERVQSILKRLKVLLIVKFGHSR